MGGGDVTVMIRYIAQPGKARRELEALVTTVVAEDSEQLLLIERWSDQAAYTGPHMQTPHIQDFITRAREFNAGPPEITFWRGVGRAER